MLETLTHYLGATSSTFCRDAPTWSRYMRQLRLLGPAGQRAPPAWRSGRAGLRRRHHATVGLAQSERTQDLAAGLVAGVVSLALRSRLKKCKTVDVYVDTDGLTLLSGQVRRATVEGVDWQSPENLTARLLQFAVGAVAIDYAALVAQRRIVLRNVPVGQGRILFNAPDFGNFLVHPLMRDAAARAVDSKPFAFDRGGVHIQLSPEPCAQFSGVAAADGKRYVLSMTPVSGSHHDTRTTSHKAASSVHRGVRVIAKAAPNGADAGPGSDGVGGTGANAGTTERDSHVSQQLTAFFNGLLIDLQGVELRFESVALSAGSKAHAVQDPVLDLQLSVQMLAFPPLNMEF